MRRLQFTSPVNAPADMPLASSKHPRRRTLRPTLESLEQRTLLSVTTAKTAMPSLATGVSAKDNQAYVTALMGANHVSSAPEAALRRKLTAELNSGTSRQQVELQLLASSPARAIQIQTTYKRLLLRSPSVSALPAVVPPEPTAVDAAQGNVPSLGLPLGVNFDFGTRMQALGTTNAPATDQNSSYSMSEDGTVWVAHGDANQHSLYTYNLQTEVWKNIYTAPGAIVSISAGNVHPGPNGVGTYRDCWIDYVASNGVTVIEEVSFGPSMSIRYASSLPGNDRAVQVAAATDGTVWALDDHGNPFSLGGIAQNSPTWTIQNTGGVNISQLAVASSNSIWALGTTNSQSTGAVFQYVGGQFQNTPSFGQNAGVSGLSATGDGTIWALAGANTVYTRPANPGTWGVVPINGSSALLLSKLAAGSQYRAITYANGQLSVISYGLADQPVTGYPSMDAGEQSGYAYINQTLDITAPGGIRSFYADGDYEPNLGFDEGTISKLKAPSGVSSADWLAIRNEIVTEVAAARDVYTVFGHINGLNASIGSALETDLSVINKSNAQNKNQVPGGEFGLFFQGLFYASLSGLAAVATDGGSIAASAIAAGIESGILTETAGDPNQQVQVTDTLLASEIATLITNTNNANSAYEMAIYANPSALLAVGNAVNSGALAWPAGSTAVVTNKVAKTFETYFLQSLVPLNWTLYGLTGYQPKTQDSSYVAGVPFYDQYFVNQNGSKTNPQGTLYLLLDSSNEVNDTSLFNAPYPQDYLTGLMPDKHNLTGVIETVIGGNPSHALHQFLSGKTNIMSVTYDTWNSLFDVP